MHFVSVCENTTVRVFNNSPRRPPWGSLVGFPRLRKSFLACISCKFVTKNIRVLRNRIRRPSEDLWGFLFMVFVVFWKTDTKCRRESICFTSVSNLLGSKCQTALKSGSHREARKVFFLSDALRNGAQNRGGHSGSEGGFGDTFTVVF